MNKLTPLLAIPILILSSCDKKGSENTFKESRYSAQTFTVAGMMAITQITDHKTNKVYFYKLEDKKGLTLKNTIDLTKCGAQNIPFEEPKADLTSKE